MRPAESPEEDAITSCLLLWPVAAMELFIVVVQRESSPLLCAGGPCFNEIGQCVGIAFQSLSHGEADGIGYVIPTPVINHFLTDYR